MEGYAAAGTCRLSSDNSGASRPEAEHEDGKGAVTVGSASHDKSTAHAPEER